MGAPFQGFGTPCLGGGAPFPRKWYNFSERWEQLSQAIGSQTDRRTCKHRRHSLSNCKQAKVSPGQSNGRGPSGSGVTCPIYPYLSFKFEQRRTERVLQCLEKPVPIPWQRGSHPSEKVLRFLGNGAPHPPEKVFQILGKGAPIPQKR